MFHALFTLVKYTVNIVDMVWLTAVMWCGAFLPERVNRHYYFGLFRLWCRFFVRALGVELRLHQKNREPLPERYVMVANHPSAFEDIGIPAIGGWLVVFRRRPVPCMSSVNQKSRVKRRLMPWWMRSIRAKISHSIPKGDARADV
ncbi:MAG: hypothetical protein FD130_278 [Halothiobacillaceae bacterium]|nr:MAG: hypothetical protein FD130_278 [Halothiobacillaceae bacterium]